MLELDFREFMDVVEKNRSIKHQDKRILHYLEEEGQFTLYIKSVDMWEYFTIVPKDKINQFGLQYEVSSERAVLDFKRNFLYDARPLKEYVPEVANMPDELMKTIKAGDDVVEEAEDYEAFLLKKFTNWETEIFKFLDRTLKDEVQKEVVQKSFGDFLRELFNRVNTVGFRQGLVSTIKATLKQGVGEAEAELKVDIGFSPSMARDSQTLADRQLEGFYIEGKRWKGIKGVSEDVQKEVSQIVRDGIVEKKGLSVIKDEIRERLDVTKGRATKIARTESNRFLNHSKVKAYQESGLVEYLEWDSFHDDRTSEICSELDKQRVKVGKFFKLEDGREFAQPPAHVMCRSVVRPILYDVD